MNGKLTWLPCNVLSRIICDSFLSTWSWGRDGRKGGEEGEIREGGGREEKRDGGGERE